MPFILVALVFVPVFLLNLQHLKYRHIPLYSWGTVIAIIHLSAGVLGIGLIPVAALVISAVIEIVYRSMTDAQRTAVQIRYASENQQVEETIAAAQSQYDQLHMICAFTADQEYQYRLALKALEDLDIWYVVRNGLLTSVFITPEDVDRAESALGIVPDTLGHDDSAPKTTPGGP